MVKVDFMCVFHTDCAILLFFIFSKNIDTTKNIFIKAYLFTFIVDTGLTCVFETKLPQCVPGFRELNFEFYFFK